MPTEAERRQRVADGSRRKRDLAAVGITETKDLLGRDLSAAELRRAEYKAEHFPDEDRYAVAAACFVVKKQTGGWNPAEVRARMQEKGWLLSQRGGAA